MAEVNELMDEDEINRNTGWPSMNRPMKKRVVCKHCGKRIVQDSAGRGWRHGETGPYQCFDTYATPKRQQAEEQSKP